MLGMQAVPPRVFSLSPLFPSPPGEHFSGKQAATSNISLLYVLSLLLFESKSKFLHVALLPRPPERRDEFACQTLTVPLLNSCMSWSFRQTADWPDN